MESNRDAFSFSIAPTIRKGLGELFGDMAKKGNTFATSLSPHLFATNSVCGDIGLSNNN